MGISRTTSDCARVGGALAGAGMFAAFGMGPAYVAVASFYALGLLLTLAIGAAPARRQAGDAEHGGDLRPSAWRELREGLAYVWSKPQLLAAMMVAFLVNLTAYPQSNGLLPYVAKDIYRIDQTGLGYLVASFAFGALLGSVAVSLRGNIRPARTMILAALAWYTMLLLFAQMPGPYGAVVMLALAGFVQSLCMVTLAVLLLRVTADKFRGRVMGVRMLAIYSLPLGLLAAGVLIDRDRLSRDGNALFPHRPALHIAHRLALAHRALACRHAGKWRRATGMMGRASSSPLEAEAKPSGEPTLIRRAPPWPSLGLPRVLRLAPPSGACSRAGRRRRAGSRARSRA